MPKKKKTGFTLAEVLVSVTIIVLLVTLSIIATLQLRVRSRDAKRVSDVTEIMNALESYYASNKAYPAAITPGQPIMSGSAMLLKAVPNNPAPRTDGGCADQTYTYTTTPTGYRLTFCIGANHGRFAQGVVICKNGNCGVKEAAQCGAGVTVTDRDGISYPTVQIGSQCWMGANLSTAHKSNGTALGWFERTCITGSGITLPGNGTPCPTTLPYLGAVYTWYAAMDGSTTPGAQGICPDGWHLPTSDEFTTLERTVCTTGTCATDFPFDITTLGVRGTNEGSKLKIGGSSGFEGGPYVGGIGTVSGNPGWTAVHWGQGVDYWTSSMADTDNALWRNFLSYDDHISRIKDLKNNRVSVRCIKNPS